MMDRPTDFTLRFCQLGKARFKDGVKEENSYGR